MSVSVSKLILFISSKSNACLPCINFVRNVGTTLPINVVRLDRIEDREAASNGPYFQIVSVPSLVVFYADGNLQVFMGSNKILSWLNSLIRAMRTRHEPPNIYSADRPSDDPHMNTRLGIPTGPLPIPPGIKRQVDHSTATGRIYQPVIDEGEDLPDENEDEADLPQQKGLKFNQIPPRSRKVDEIPPLIVEDDSNIPDEPEEIIIEAKPKKTAKKRSKKKTINIDTIDETPVNEDLNLMEKGKKMAQNKLNSARSAKTKSTSSRMKDIYQVAQQMQKDRTDSLGYNDEV